MSLESELAHQLGIGFDAAVDTNHERPRRRELQQGRVRLGSFEHLLRQLEAPRGHKGNRRRNAQPEQRQSHDPERRCADCAHEFRATPSARSYGQAGEKRKGRKHLASCPCSIPEAWLFLEVNPRSDAIVAPQNTGEVGYRTAVCRDWIWRLRVEDIVNVNIEAEVMTNVDAAATVQVQERR